MNKLLYIHPIGLEGADMEHRANIARSIGYEVVIVPNEPYVCSEIEDDLMTYVTEPECAGVWADVEADKIDGLASRLLMLAYEADKPLLGRQRSMDDILHNLVEIIGVPEIPDTENTGEDTIV